MPTVSHPHWHKQGFLQKTTKDIIPFSRPRNQSEGPEMGWSLVVRICHHRNCHVALDNSSHPLPGKDAGRSCKRRRGGEPEDDGERFDSRTEAAPPLTCEDKKTPCCCAVAVAIFCSTWKFAFLWFFFYQPHRRFLLSLQIFQRLWFVSQRTLCTSASSLPWPATSIWLGSSHLFPNTFRSITCRHRQSQVSLRVWFCKQWIKNNFRPFWGGHAPSAIQQLKYSWFSAGRKKKHPQCSGFIQTEHLFNLVSSNANPMNSMANWVFSWRFQEW